MGTGVFRTLSAWERLDSRAKAPECDSCHVSDNTSRTDLGHDPLHASASVSSLVFLDFSVTFNLFKLGECGRVIVKRFQLVTSSKLCGPAE